MANKKKVFVGMSGGVDSSVAALLLKEAGFDVTGVFIQGWYPDFLECGWKDDRRDAMRVAAVLDIPFLTIDAEEAYKTEVVDYMVSEYSKGRVPNPDVMCNRHVKFGVFYNKAREMGADFIATGHYARVESGELGVVSETQEARLYKGIDQNKDQSYFLWNVDKEALAHTLFPIGDYEKSEIREIAKKQGLSTADKKDSQGICFLGKVSMKEFLSHYTNPEQGDVLDVNRNVIGHHPGALLFTLGERRGFTVTKKGTDDAPRFVVDKDIEANTITVSEKSAEDFKNFSTESVILEQENWIGEKPAKGESVEARHRYRGELVPAALEETEDGTKIVFKNPQQAVSPGQSLVVYKGDKLLGGGIISNP